MSIRKLLRKYMCPFIETIAIVGGQARHLSYHERRFNATRQHFFPEAETLSLAPILADAPLTEGLVKARLVYDERGLINKTYQPYTMRQVQSLQLIRADDMEYPFKNTDRSHLNALFAQRQGCDDILIIKNGLVTDTSFTNVALFDGHQWFTPDTPLLPGTMRAWLLDQGFITSHRITVNDLPHFHFISLINALIPLGRCIVPINQVMK